MSISAGLVKELRERTGAGMMECKKALTATEGDIDAAIEQLRKSGMAKADKKAGRTAAEGLVAYRIADDGGQAVVVEVNCETDFVSAQDDFRDFVEQVIDIIWSAEVNDVDALLALDAGGAPLDQRRQELVARIGENIQIRRFERLKSAGGSLGGYLHGKRIGVLVDIAGGDDELRKDVAMHIAASRPLCLREEDVPAEMLAKEREILLAQIADSGKPPEIQEKMVTGRIKKFYAEVVLLNQAFVKDDKQSVGQLVKAAGATLNGYLRYEVGEGVEKKQENFAEEVMAQARSVA